MFFYYIKCFVVHMANIDGFRVQGVFLCMLDFINVDNNDQPIPAIKTVKDNSINILINRNKQSDN